MSEWCGDADPVSVYNETRVKARKVHTCAACKDPIAIGHVYVRVAIVYDGTVDTLKRCLRCQVMHEHLRSIRPYDEWPNETLDCGHEYEEIHGQPPPPEIAALAFMTPEQAQRELTRG